MKKTAYSLYCVISIIAVIFTTIAILKFDQSVVSPLYIVVLANLFYAVYAYRKARKL